VWYWLCSVICWWRDPWHGTASVWKPLGKTPLEIANAFRAHGIFVRGRRVPVPDSVPIGYAGRLDPMAEGVLLLLLGDTCKEIARYRDHDKTYIVEVLLGVKTDTGDLLGIAKKVAPLQDTSQTFSQNNLAEFLQEFIGAHEWEYPVFSSKTVQGKPLFRWFYEGRIGDIVIPKRTMVIHTVRFVGVREISVSELREQVHARIAQVTQVEEVDKEWGKDFRRTEVLAVWGSHLGEHTTATTETSHGFTVLTFECQCGSGTYMRTLAEKIGEKIGVPACAFSIMRIQVG
jgi:tRNA pseudouridine(55) synthase